MAKPRFSNIELVNPLNSPLSPYMPSFGGRALLSSQDRVLIDNGGSGYRGLDIYLSLFLNPVVYKSWNKLMTEICSRELRVQPYDNSKEAARVAKFVEQQLNGLGKDSTTNVLLPAQGGFDTLTRALGMAYITGISAAELVWGRDQVGNRVIQYFKSRDPRLFRMEYDAADNVTRPRVLTRTDQIRGTAIPAYKFAFHRFWAMPSDDEYGCGLGRNLYYAVEWQKQLMSYWLMLVDKTVMPSTVGSYSSDAKATVDDVAKFEEAVRNFGQDSAIVLAPGFSIDTKDLRVSNIDVLEKLIERVDSYIETLISGESATGKAGAGSEAKDRVSDGIRISTAKSVSDMISDTINLTVVKWLVKANFYTDAPMPTVWRNFSEDIKPEPTNIDEIESIADFVDMLGKLDSVGLSLDRDYIQSRIKAPLKRLKRRAPAGSQPTASTGTALFDNVPSPRELLGG